MSAPIGRPKPRRRQERQAYPPDPENSSRRGVPARSSKPVEDEAQHPPRRASSESWARLRSENNVVQLIKLFRREDDPEFLSALFGKIERCLKTGDNAKIVRQKFLEVGGSLLAETKRLVSSDCLDVTETCARCLGRIGSSMDEDLPRYLGFLRERYSSEKLPVMRRTCLNALCELVRLERRWAALPMRVYPEALIKHLKTFLDEADTLDTLVPVVDAFALLAETHPHEVQPQFEVSYPNVTVISSM
jgi:hypothetical protein